MKNKVVGILVLVFLALPVQALAHSGRTDSSGGHNCNVGSCAGTYHYHNGGSYTPPPIQPVVTTKTITETEAIEFQTVEQNNNELAVGQQQVLQAGVSGVKTHTYKITYTDGVQTNKQLLSSTVTTNPINKIVAVGTKTETPAVASASTEKPPESDDTASTGEALGGLAILSSLGYGAFRFGKFGLAKIKGT